MNDKGTTATNKSRRDRPVDRTFARAFANYTPPADLTVSEWAEAHRVLSRENSAEAGPWRNARTPYLVEIMDSFTDPKVEKISLVASSQVGKALAIDTPIPTPDGWKEMRELRRGDMIFGADGTPCMVTACTEIMYNRPCYELTFSDGSKITADACHKWYVEYDGRSGVLATEEIARDFRRANRNKYAIPVNGPLKTEPVHFLLPPYTLGAWLGDGNSYSAQITTATDDVEIIENIKAEGVAVRVRERGKIYNAMIMPKASAAEMSVCIRGHVMSEVGRTKKGLCAECARQHSKHSQYGFAVDAVVNEQVTGNSLLTKMGVLKNKHIPPEYLRGSHEQRLGLLQGIMDTDGTIGESGRCEITLKSKRLASDVCELLNTLGIKNTMARKIAVCTNSARRATSEVWRVSFMAYDDMPIFRLRRKAERMVSRDGVGRMGGPRRVSETTRRHIVDVRPVASVPVKCISVNSPDRLYLAGRQMIPTHNSELELNVIGYIIDQDPGSILYIQPTVDDAKKFSRLRIAPMIRDSATLRQKVADIKSRDSGNTMLQKSFPGGMLTIVGSNSASGLASTPAKYVLGDERDRWALSAGTEGDPWALAEARTTTFYNSKMIDVSTPTDKETSPIAKSFNEGTRERWCHKCPHCGEYSNIVFDNIKFEFETVGSGRKKDYVIKSIVWSCPECGCISSEEEMRRQPAKWIAENPDAYEKGHRSFWLNAFSSPWQSWHKVVYSFLVARKDPQRLKVVYNTMLGELWEDRGDLEDEDTMLSRREDYGNREDGTPIELPDGVLVLTCGVDVQDDRLEFETVGHGHYGETWGIKKGIIMGDPADDATWTRLDDVIDHVYRFKSGRGLSISITMVDSGGHKTQHVYKQCRARLQKRVFAIKGQGGDGIPFTRPPSKVKIIVNGKAVGQTWLYSIGVDAGKAEIMGALKVQEPGAKFCHFPKGEERGYDAAFFNGLLSEKLVMKSDRGRTRWAWVKLPGHERNEALDCRNYALAGLRVLDPDMDAVERRLRGIDGADGKPQEKQQRRAKVKRSLSAADDW